MAKDQGGKKPKNRKRRGRGEGGICWREERKCWEGSVSLGYDGEGKRKRKRVFGETKDAVLREMDRLKSKATSGVVAEADGLTVADNVRRWLDASKSKTAPRTFEERERVVRTILLPRIGRTQLSKLNALHVENLYSEMAREKVAASPARHAALCLTASLKYAVRRGFLAASPAAGVPLPPEPRREMECLDADQLGLLLAEASRWPIAPLVTLAAHTGLRQGELLGLAWDDLDLDLARVSVRRSLTWTKSDGFAMKEPKTAASRRTVVIPRPAVAAMLSHKEAQKRAGLLRAPVFCTKSGGHVFRGNVSRSLKAVIDRINDPHDRKGGRPKEGAPPPPERARLNLVPDGLRFHDLRHTHASILLSKGQSLRAVSVRLGHSNPALTLRIYAHCLPGDDLQLADAFSKLFE